MPLTSRISDTEPRKKRAKTEPKQTLPSTSKQTHKNKKETINNQNTSTTSSTENEESLNKNTPAGTTRKQTRSRASLLTNKTNKKDEIKSITTTDDIITTTNGNATDKNEKETTTNEKTEITNENITSTNENTATENENTTTSNENKTTTDEIKTTTNENTETINEITTTKPGENKTNTNLNSTSNNISANTTGGFASNSIITNNEDTLMTDVSQATTNIDTTVNTTSNQLPELSTVINRGTTKPGYVLAVGENLSNQLGLGCEVDDRKKPQLVKELPKNIIQIAAGGMHSACLTQDGIVYTFGCNDEYALGRDNDDEIDKVNLPEKSVEITTGDSHTAALSESGIVYAWGTFRDGSGVLGLENKKIAKIPIKFKLSQKIAKISSGADHLVFLTTTGEVYTAGNSEHGQLGRISKYNSCRGGRRGCDMILEPGLVRFGKRKELQGHRQIEDIWTTSYCTFLKVKDSDLTIGFGLNNCFQLGIEDAENRYQPDILQSLKFEGKLKKVIGGMHHTLFLDTNGFVYSMGSHRYGGLGLGKIDADLKAPQKINDLKDIVDIAANTNVSYAIDKYGKVLNWGTNYSKQLGQDTEDDYFVPTLLNSRQLETRDVYTVSIGGQHSLFIVSEEKDKDEQDSM